MTQTAISLDSVRFNYGRQQGNSWDLAIPSWQIKTGESVFLHGPSGAGKTTLLNLIAGVLNLQEGDIQVLKTSLPQLSARQRDRFRANHIGYVFQQFNLVPYLNAVENIQLARFFSNKHFSDSLPAETLLRALQIEPSVWQRPTSTLSLGQQQRVAIARAMVNQPEVLIVDEPTSSLDKANRDRFMNLLMQQVEAQSTTLLFVSHDMALSTFFSRIDALNELIEQ